MEWLSFGPFLHWCRCACLDRLTGCRRALVLGDGDGRFAARMLQVNRDVTVEAVDSSAAMLRALIRRAGPDASRVNAQVADLRRWEPTSAGHDLGYDLIVTHFLLDCLTGEEVRRLARAVRSAADEDALWVISEFAIPESRVGRCVAQPLMAGLYWAFGLLAGLSVRRLPDYATALAGAGFALHRRRRWLGGLLVSELWGSVHASAEPLQSSARTKA